MDSYNPFMQERLTQLRYEDLPPEVRPLADDILKISSAALGGPYNALLRSPDMARRCFDLLDYLRLKTSVNKRLNEFAILIQARIANAQYELWAHETIARRAGLSDAVMRELQQCHVDAVKHPAFWRVQCLCHGSPVSRNVFVPDLRMRCANSLFNRALEHYLWSY